MGSSTRKKKEKQKDFQKPKLKVGKAKIKAPNFTDTSFRSRAIVVNQQSLSEHAPDPAVQFQHHLSLAATSRSENQRRDALAYLTSQLAAAATNASTGHAGPKIPVGTAHLLGRLLPLVSDPAPGVRAQLLKLFRVLPAADVRPAAGQILLYVRAGITNLSSAVRDDALGTLEWLLDVAGDELVASPGGWLKTLNGLGAMMGWVAAGSLPSAASGWTVAPKTSYASGGGSVSGSGSGSARSTSSAAVAAGRPSSSFSSSSSSSASTAQSQSYARQISALAKFLSLGLRQEQPASYNPQAFWYSLFRMPAATACIPPPSATAQANAVTTAKTAKTVAHSIAPTTAPFAHLNLFGVPRDEDSEMYADREARQRVFAKRWHAAIVRCVDEARREGGAVGRAAATLAEVVREGMGDYEEAAVAE